VGQKAKRDKKGGKGSSFVEKVNECLQIAITQKGQQRPLKVTKDLLNSPTSEKFVQRARKP
jgi:hypothetical protein